jgi:hypothetical protein
MRLATLVLSATLALALGGCAMHHGRDGQQAPMGHRGLTSTPPDPQQPRVGFVRGRIVIDQETIRFAKGKRDVLITWRVSDPSRLRFPKDGIVFEPQAAKEIVDCRVADDGLSFSCRNLNSRRDWYKYDVRLLVDGKEVKPLDPYVLND